MLKSQDTAEHLVSVDYFWKVQGGNKALLPGQLEKSTEGCVTKSRQLSLFVFFSCFHIQRVPLFIFDLCASCFEETPHISILMCYFNFNPH